MPPVYSLFSSAFVFLFTALAFPLAAQDVQGSLLSAEGRPLGGYPIIVESLSDPENTRVEYTDIKGGFWIEDLEPGTYVITPANEPQPRAIFTLEQHAKPPYDISDWDEVEPGSFKSPDPAWQEAAKATSKLRAHGIDESLQLDEYLFLPDSSGAPESYTLDSINTTWPSN